MKRICVLMVAMLMFVSAIAEAQEPVPGPEPIPEPILWLAIPQLRTAQDSVVAELGLIKRVVTPEGGYISVGAKVIFDLLAPATKAVLGPAVPDGWTMSHNIIGDTLKACMAGTSPLLDGEAFLKVVFNTSSMKLGDKAPIEVRVRLNEESEITIHGAIEFKALLGDVSLDGEVTAYDAALILQYDVGLISPANYPGLCLEIADVSGNGEITGYDAALILQFVVGIINHFPVEGKEEPTPPPEEEESVVEAEPTGVGKMALYGPRTVKLGEVEETAGEFAVPVLIGQMDGVISGKVEIAFDSGLEVLAVQPGKLLDGYLLASKSEAGRLAVAFAGSQASTGSGELFRISFGSDPGKILLKSVELNEGQIPVSFSTLVEPTTWGQVKSRFFNK